VTTYFEELGAVPTAVVDGLRIGAGLDRARDKIVVAVGSGGSFSVARLVADLADQGGSLGVALTPLALLARGGMPVGAHIVLCSAGGNNSDARALARRVAQMSGDALTVLTGAGDSALKTAARDIGAQVAEVPLPSGEGFVATTSLAGLSAAALAWLAPPEAVALATAGLQRLAPPVGAAHVWQRATILLLHGANSRAAAVDVESKFVEGALGHVQVADYRNFAHGRFHWPMAHPNTGVVVLSAGSEADLAERTLAAIPESIPRLHVAEATPGPAASLLLLLRSLHMVGDVARHRGLDPATTPTPGWGKALYEDAAL